MALASRALLPLPMPERNSSRPNLCHRWWVTAVTPHSRTTLISTSPRWVPRRPSSEASCAGARWSGRSCAEPAPLDVPDCPGCAGNLALKPDALDDVDVLVDGASSLRRRVQRYKSVA